MTKNLCDAKYLGAVLGGLSAQWPPELTLSPSFLGTGRYTVRIWQAAADAEVDPNHLTTENLNQSSADRSPSASRATGVSWRNCHPQETDSPHLCGVGLP